MTISPKTHIEVRSAKGTLVTTVSDHEMLKSWLDRAPRAQGLKIYLVTTSYSEIQA